MTHKEVHLLKEELGKQIAARKVAENRLNEEHRLLEDMKNAKQQLEFQLDEKAAQIQGLFENINDAYILMDIFGKVLKMNSIAITFLGYSLKEDLNVQDLIHPEETEYAAKSFEALKENGLFTNYTTRVLTKDGTVKWVQINGALIFNELGKPIAAQGIIRDITEFKALEQQKEDILRKLEKRNNELYEYAHVVSHDLKSPLRSINALVSWVKSDNQGKLDSSTLENFSLIENTIETMEQLINNILEYSSADTVIDDSIDVDLNDTLEHLRKTLLIPDHISLKILTTLPTIHGDPTKFQQVFQNLICNAAKFIDKEKGLIEINVKEKQEFYIFSIKDNGIGIEKKFHNSIFKIFHSLNKSKDSTGIGLSIVKKIVEFYGGEIWVESEPKISTTFYFTLKKQ
jgi:PAS domain S-box-containing protein